MFVVAGETIIDMIEESPNVFTAYTGGGPYNVAKGAARMGTETGYISPISTDSFGARYLTEMQDEGIAALSPRSDWQSGIAIVQKDAAGVPSYSFFRERAADRDIGFDKIRAVLPANARAFYIGGLALADGNDAQIWVDILAEIAVPVVVDPNVRPSFIRDREAYLTRLSAVYDAANIVKLSDEDIEWLDPNIDPRDYIQAMMSQHRISVGFLTLGAEGALVYSQEGHVFYRAPKIEVVDTVGAGDTFSAAVVSSLLRDNAIIAPSIAQLESALGYGVNAAAINCLRAGANPPTHDEIIAFG